MKKSSKRPDPDRGFGKFYITHEMLIRRYACTYWQRKLFGDESKHELVLTKKEVTRILRATRINKTHYITPPVFWVITKLITTGGLKANEYYEIREALLEISEKTSWKQRFKFPHSFELVRTLLNYLYDKRVRDGRP